MTRRHPHVANLDEVEVIDELHGKFASRERFLAEATGGKQLGCSHVELPPGTKAWPFHYHCSNEEAIYVLEGTGIARIGDARVEIRAGDYLAFPLGDKNPHQTINTGTVPLKYLCFSTMHPVDVIGYPDSGKVGARAREVMSDGSARTIVRENFRPTGKLDYWADEPDST